LTRAGDHSARRKFFGILAEPFGADYHVDSAFCFLRVAVPDKTGVIQRIREAHATGVLAENPGSEQHDFKEFSTRRDCAREGDQRLAASKEECIDRNKESDVAGLIGRCFPAFQTFPAACRTYKETMIRGRSGGYVFCEVP